MAAESIASLLGVSFWYPEAERPALREVDLELVAGELLLVCGPSGCGKSTLLRLLQGIVPQLSGGDLAGEVRVLGLDPTRLRPHDLATAGVTLAYQNAVEGFVAQTVADEVAFGPESLALPRDEVTARVRSALEDVALAPASRRALATLSGGEQQRVALAAALALRPRILLLDEPTAHLDERSATLLLELVDRMRYLHRMTVVLSEHRLGTAAPRADRVAVLVDGALAALGPPREALAGRSLARLGVPVPRATQAALGLGLEGAAPLTADELAARLAGRVPRASARAPAGPSLSGDAALGVDLQGAAPRAVGEVALGFEEVSFRYPGAGTDALSGVSVALRHGERVALTGSSGSGKSTLARLALGLRRPTAGSVTVLGMRDADTGTLARRVGLVLQNPMHQLLAETVADEVALGLRDRSRAEARRLADGAIERFALGELLRRHPLSLSEGQRRRVALAAVVAREPELLVLDEPTLAQDEEQRAALAALVRELAGRGTTVLAITHDREFVNDACERVVALRGGRIAADLPLGGDRARLEALEAAGIPLADVPATVLALGRAGAVMSARTLDELAAVFP